MDACKRLAKMVGARPSWMVVYMSLPWALSSSESACTNIQMLNRDARKAKRPVHIWHAACKTARIDLMCTRPICKNGKRDSNPFRHFTTSGKEITHPKLCASKVLRGIFRKILQHNGFSQHLQSVEQNGSGRALRAAGPTLQSVKPDDSRYLG